MRVRGAFVLIASMAVVLAAGPAWAQGEGTSVTVDQDSTVVFNGGIVVADGQRTQDAISFNGDVTVDGLVTGTALSFNGDVTVNGKVTGDAIAFNGRVRVGPGATVGGNVVSRFTPRISPDATVKGQTQKVDVNIPGWFGWATYALLWFATVLSSLILGLLLVLIFPKGMRRVGSTATESAGASLGFGFLAFFGIPIVAAIAAGIVVGLPLALALFLALFLIYWIGWIAAAQGLGQLLVKPPKSTVLAFFVGWLILSGLLLLPFLGGLIWFVASAWGLGAIAVAGVRAGRGEETPAPAAATPPPAPPVPTA
jgi:cytoskeletal protein CcmA (bactofilin family)